MAEILVKAIDATHPDPVKDARGCYKRGDPVCVQPDGWAWGAKEGLPLFWIVKIPGATVAQVQGYIDAGTGRRRAWGLDTTKMTGAIRNQLTSTGTISATLAQVQNFLAKKG